jgi:hypothetical protein
METSTSTFRVLKASWGIWLQITGLSIPNKDKKHNFKINLENDLNFSQEELEYINSGFNWLLPIIEKKVSPKRTIIITKIKIVLTDYQKEGLFYGIVFWLSEHFNFEMPNFECEYDKEQNKYIFSELNEIMKEK